MTVLRRLGRVLLLFPFIAPLAAQDADVPESWLGVWKLNAQKSIAAGADPKEIRPTTTPIRADIGKPRCAPWVSHELVPTMRCLPRVVQAGRWS